MSFFEEKGLVEHQARWTGIKKKVTDTVVVKTDGTGVGIGLRAMNEKLPREAVLGVELDVVIGTTSPGYVQWQRFYTPTLTTEIEWYTAWAVRVTSDSRKGLTLRWKNDADQLVGLTFQADSEVGLTFRWVSRIESRVAMVNTFTERPTVTVAISKGLAFSSTEDFLVHIFDVVDAVCKFLSCDN